jgi:hypothetical protein
MNCGFFILVDYFFIFIKIIVLSLKIIGNEQTTTLFIKYY